MSFYFITKLKRKKEFVKYAPEVMVLYTTEARELYDMVSLVAYGGESSSNDKEIDYDEKTEYGPYTVLTNDKLQEIIDAYAVEMDNCKQAIQAARDRVDELRDQIKLITNIDIYRQVQDDIAEDKDAIKYWQDEYERFDSLRRNFCFLQSMLSENENFELVYYGA